MVASTATSQISCPQCASARSVVAWLAAGVLLLATPTFVFAESAADDGADPFETTAQQTDVSSASIESATAAAYDPFEAQPAVYDPFDSAAVDAAVHFAELPAIAPQHELVFLQAPTNDANPSNNTTGGQPGQEAKPEAATDPCAVAAERPLGELGINIMLPAGLLPKDYAAACWTERNATGGPSATMRAWPVLPYYWDAPCLCYGPLYFEEINLERYGYGCCACIQPAVSAAHFFGTIPALPYCMAEHCPNKCQYTLGHYRPGSCPPWRFHWPSCKPIAAASEAGVVTGLIFAIP